MIDGLRSRYLIRSQAARQPATARRGVLTLVGGTAAGQVIALLAVPVLSRLYSPADFGVFAVVTATAAILTTLMALRMELAVPLAKDQVTAFATAHVGLCSIALTTVLGTGLMLVIGDKVAIAFGQPRLMPWLVVMPALAGVLATFTVLNALAVRAARYTAIARRSIFQSIATTMTQIGLAAAPLQAGGLIIGYGSGQAVGAASMLFGSGLRSTTARASRGWEPMQKALARFYKFPLLLGPAGLLNSAGIYLPFVLLAYFYGSEVAGWLGLTQRVLAAPVTLIGAAASQVYLGELTRDLRDGSGVALTLFRSATLRLATVGVIAAGVLLIGGPWIFALVFGRDWAPSGQFAQAFAVSLAAQLIAAPLSQSLIVYERQSIQLAYDASRLAVTAGAVLAVGLLGGAALAAAWALGIASAIMYAVSWVLSRATVRSSLLDSTTTLRGR